MKKKALIPVIAIALAVCCAVGGTVAWLIAHTDEKVNTFTVGNIDIELTETTGEEYKMVPGDDIAKDPRVIVEGGSEACYLFVTVEKSTDPAFDTYMTCEIAAGWTPLDETNYPGVYYREVAASENDQDFNVLLNNQVTVKGTVTKDMMDDIKDGTVNEPTLTFDAFAVQKAGMQDAAAAWAAVQEELNPAPGA